MSGRAVVIDLGTSVCKGGISGDISPSVFVETVVGRPKDNLGYVPQRSLYIGEEATARPNLLDMNYPIVNGIIKNWDDMELVLTNIYETLKKDPKEQPVLLTNSPTNTSENREKTTQLMFEKFSVPSLFISNHSIPALYASSRTTGVVVDIGDGACNSICIYEGSSIPDSLKKWDVGGKDLTLYLKTLLEKKGVSLDNLSAQDIKEKHCYVAEDYDNEKRGKQPAINYELDDGRVISIDNERFQCPEALFNTALVKEDFGGISKSVYESIETCDILHRKDYYSNIVLAGGSSMFRGIEKRMHWELQELASPSHKVKIIANNDRKYATWMGASIMAALQTFKTKFLTKEEYQEKGYNAKFEN